MKVLLSITPRDTHNDVEMRITYRITNVILADPDRPNFADVHKLYCFTAQSSLDTD
jgi:hypothetical protein